LGSARWQISLLAAPLALLPALQFWHGTSFVPSHLLTSVGITAKASVQRSLGKTLQGVVEINFQNNGDVGALVLASEVTVCFTDSLETVDKSLTSNQMLYDQQGEACHTKQIFDHFSVIDGKTTWVYHSAFTTAADKPLILLQAHLWYARNDRLRIDEAHVQKVTKTAHPGVTDADVKACRGDVTIYKIRDEAKFKGVVQRQRLVVYDDEHGVGDAYFNLTTPGVALCRQPDPSGLPRPEDALPIRVGADVGAAEVYTRQTDWLAAPK
jgi:hypothetical protein